MATRQDVYEKFGMELLEAITLVLKDEINMLRAEAGLPERTNQQVTDALFNKLDAIIPIDVG